jgi:rhodanese-related sulfurtransferase
LVSGLTRSTTTAGIGVRTIANVLDEARGRLSRLTPAQALDAQGAGAVVVDIRPEYQRSAEGEWPGALVIDRNVLEWRFDPQSDARLPIADYSLHVIVLCREGYASSLAAASLQELGIFRATDVIGGHLAWLESSGR